jgi:hypothetical protein
MLPAIKKFATGRAETVSDRRWSEFQTIAVHEILFRVIARKSTKGGA